MSYLLGTDSELVNTSEAEALRMMDVAFSIEFDPDETATLLCRSTFEAIPDYMHVSRDWMARHLIGFFYALSRQLLGRDLADRLAHPQSTLPQRLACRAFVSCMWLAQRVPGLSPRFLEDRIGIRFWLEHMDYRTTMPEPGGVTGESAHIN